MMNDYPRSWASQVKIKDVCTIRAGNGFPIAFQGKAAGELGFFKVGDISRNWQEGRIALSNANHYLSTKEAAQIRAQPFPGGTVVFAKIGAAVALNRRALLATRALVDNNVMGLIPNGATTSRYLFYFMCQIDLGARTRGGNVPSLRNGDVEEIDYPLPPLAEQRRIVAKIEELFSELDKGIENLKQARAQLAVYRQSLLKYAFEGKLTAAWRAAHENQLESAEQLLSRIRAERKTRYEKQIVEWQAALETWKEAAGNGPKPSKPREPKELRPLAEGVREKLAELPLSWSWDVLGWMTRGVEYGSAAKSSKSGTHVVLRMGNLQNGKLDWGDLAFSSDASEIEQYILHPGDVLFNRTNSPEWVGKTSIYRGERPALFAGYLIRINHSDEAVRSDYLNWFLNSPVAKQHGNTVKTDGVNQSNINGDKLVNYPFPYCSLAEQREIVRILEELISLIDSSEDEIDVNLQKAEALRQSILKKAFAGELMPQDPADEPAATLLARIRAERANQAAAPKTKKPRTAKV